MALKKLAVFVEGMTERIFVERFIKELAGERNVFFEVKSFPSHRGVAFHQIPEAGQGNFFVLIYDCQNDEQVKSVILDRREALESAGYSLILGLRDVYPTPLSEVHKVAGRLAYGVPTKGIPTHILLAVTEIESWFLQEATHYLRIDNLLDVSEFKSKFNFDPTIDSAETIEHPAQLLDEIYKSIGKRYKKRRAHIARTVGALDIDNMYMEAVKLLPHFQIFVGHIDGFLT